LALKGIVNERFGLLASSEIRLRVASVLETRRSLDRLRFSKLLTPSVSLLNAKSSQAGARTERPFAALRNGIGRRVEAIAEVVLRHDIAGRHSHFHLGSHRLDQNA